MPSLEQQAMAAEAKAAIMAGPSLLSAPRTWPLQAQSRQAQALQALPVRGASIAPFSLRIVRGCEAGPQQREQTPARWHAQFCVFTSFQRTPSLAQPQR
jgi:hypothetical protein